MALLITNSMTRRKEVFEPGDPASGRVSVYNCGPTVYDHFHIGNARNFVVMDIVRRWLARRWTVTFTQNLTDVDDKIIRRAQDEGKTFDEIRLTYIAAYFADAAKLRIRVADNHPRATEFIPQMIELVQRLERKGLAYPAGGSVYFRVRAFANYGRLSGRSIDDLLEGARVDVNEEKADPLDFALWKAAKPGEPTWDSPWGAGRPGWHLECSAMAMSLMGETIDIHAGGVDLTFPHHENEIAQSEGCTGKTFARFWMHNGFLNIDGAKMAKSAGNFLKIDQILARHPVEAVRAFLMSAHYRSPLDTTEEAFIEAAAATRRINDGIDTGEKMLALLGGSAAGTDWRADPAAAEIGARFEEAMDDDFNTPRAMAALHDALTAVHETIKRRPIQAGRLAALVALAVELRDFFSIEPAGSARAADAADADLLELVAAIRAEADGAGVAATEAVNGSGDPSHNGAHTIGGAMTGLLTIRKLARKQKAFAVADHVRDRLGSLGFALEDYPEGTIWKKTG